MDRSELLSVLVADDHADLTLLYSITINRAPGMRCVGAIHSAARLLHEVEAKHPDVVLLDLCMPGPPPLESMSEVLSRHPDVCFIVISGYDDSECRIQALQAGARGFITKGNTPAFVIEAIRSAALLESSATLPPRSAH
ncbi:MAG: response regulator transcription factor [Phycisphaerales bacterium]